MPLGVEQRRVHGCSHAILPSLQQTQGHIYHIYLSNDAVSCSSTSFYKLTPHSGAGLCKATPALIPHLHSTLTVELQPICLGANCNKNCKHFVCQQTTPQTPCSLQMTKQLIRHCINEHRCCVQAELCNETERCRTSSGLGAFQALCAHDHHSARWLPSSAFGMINQPPCSVLQLVRLYLNQ